MTPNTCNYKIAEKVKSLHGIAISLDRRLAYNQANIQIYIYPTIKFSKVTFKMFVNHLFHLLLSLFPETQGISKSRDMFF